METRALILDGFKHALSIPTFWIYLLVTFIGLGIFNGITTWIENIARPRGFSPTDAGMLGAIMLLGGILGALVIPALSDRQHKRQRFLLIGFAGAIPGLLGLTFATTLPLMILSAFVLGFFLVSAGPVGMQYAAEVTYPTPEGTSNGLIQLFGQASVVFVYIMEALKAPDGAFTPALLLAGGLMLVSLVLINFLKDPQVQPVPAPEIAYQQ
jgi:cyanate permease